MPTWRSSQKGRRPQGPGGGGGGDGGGRDDAVALDELGAAARGRPEKGGAPLSRLVTFKAVVALFVVFVLVVSDVFTNNVISGFRGAVRCRAPTSYGVAVQGIFLVIFYVLALYLIEGGIV